MEQSKKEIFQWHPAFYAGLQVELKEDAQNLIFENEHQLGTRPKETDVLVIKRQKELPVHKNIGRIFRKYNIIEYKSPVDYLGIDDFYKVYGYLCFYKADTQEEDGISVEELTLSLMCTHYPRKLMEHLRKVRRYQIQKMDEGIYYILGDMIPIQIVCLRELSEDENLWLKCLTNRLEKKETVEKLLEAYEEHMNEGLYRSVMDMIVRANKKKFKEAEEMCEALEELLYERFKEKHKDEAEAEKEAAIEAAVEAAVEATRMESHKVGLQEGEELFARLSCMLLKSGRQEEILKAAQDREYRQKLFEELGIKTES